MNKNVNKVLILFAATALAVFGIMYFYKTIVSPPRKLEFTHNRHYECIVAKTESLDSCRVGYRNDSLYEAISDMIRLCGDMNYISASEQESAMRLFMQKYIPLFSDWCYSRFQESVWHEREHPYMRNRIDELGQEDAASFFRDSLRGIQNIIENYERAKGLSTSFRGVLEAKNTIKSANEYKKMEYLRNCTALVSKLNKVPEYIGESHYNYLVSLKDNLWNYPYWDAETFENEFNAFSDEVLAYQNNQSIYGTYRTVDVLKKEARDILTQAQSYYDSMNGTENE